jgi:hypothetical protein
MSMLADASRSAGTAGHAGHLELVSQVAEQRANTMILTKYFSLLATSY